MWCCWIFPSADPPSTQRHRLHAQNFGQSSPDSLKLLSEQIEPVWVIRDLVSDAYRRNAARFTHFGGPMNTTLGSSRHQVASPP